MTSPEIKKQYHFLHDHIAREAHMLEVLQEIDQYQNRAIKEKEGSLATLESLANSRSITMPFSPSRKKNIHYLLDTLTSNYPEQIKQIISFRFHADPETKKLSVDESIEYTVQLDHARVSALQKSRDQQSMEDFATLVKRFRLFNLSKLMKQATQRKHLAALIKQMVDNRVFVFRRYALDQRKQEQANEFCFHRENFDAVRQGLTLDSLLVIMEHHRPQIERRLKSFGIYSTEVSDYRDTKLDYILSILTEDLKGSMTPQESVEVQNIASLRKCLLKVEKSIDPMLALEGELTHYTEEHRFFPLNDLKALSTEITDEMLHTWVSERMEKGEVLLALDERNRRHLVHGPAIASELEQHYRAAIIEPESVSRDELPLLRDRFETLIETVRTLLEDSGKSRLFFSEDDEREKSARIVREYDEHLRSREMARENEAAKQDKGGSFLETLLDFFKGLFGGSGKSRNKGSRNKPSQRSASTKGSSSSSPQKKKPMSQITRNIYREIESRSAPIIPLSDFLDLGEKESKEIDTVINDLRAHNSKIVIPIYNARSTLYPKRSARLLTADTEYLMIDPAVIESADTVRAFIDSLGGYALHDEVLSISALNQIERYLLNLQRRNKKKKMPKK